GKPPSRQNAKYFCLAQTAKTPRKMRDARSKTQDGADSPSFGRRGLGGGWENYTNLQPSPYPSLPKGGEPLLELINTQNANNSHSRDRRLKMALSCYSQSS